MDKVQWKKGIKNDDHMQNEARYCSKQAWQKNNLETEKDKYASLTEKKKHLLGHTSQFTPEHEGHQVGLAKVSMHNG